METNVNEPLMKCRKLLDEVKTGRVKYPRISLTGTCLLVRWPPARRWRELEIGFCVERGNLSF